MPLNQQFYCTLHKENETDWVCLRRGHRKNIWT